MEKEKFSLKWGIIGIGRHAGRFMAPAIQKHSGSQILAVYSRDIQRARQFAQDHNCPLAYDSLDALLENKDINVVYIGSPNHIHREQVLLAAQAGKHILCEKPLATTVEDAQIMVEACRKAGVKLGVSFHLRHNPIHLAVKEKIQAELLGDLLMVDVQYMHVTAGAESTYKLPTWRTDPVTAGGAGFIGTGIHAIDLLRYISGQEILNLCAFGDKSWYSSGTEKLIQASLYLGNGIVSSLSGGMMKYPFNNLIVYGTKATVRCNGSLGYYGGGRLELISDLGTQTTEFPNCDVYAREIEAFAESIQFDKEPNASGRDGLRAVEVVTGIYESLKTRSSVNLENEISNSNMA